ncbi:MAG: hypothetical protein MZV63_08065 [Marinilabiliales bacterium]|nr:hypothetical protein [Marinilabiliales bacterium]
MTGEGIADGAPEDLMLTGTVARAFESPLLSFSSSEGTFSFIRGMQTGIALEGTGLAARLTEKALSRCGYRTDPQAAIKVKVRETLTVRNGLYSDGLQTDHCRSLYDLVSILPGDAGQLP